jgi:ABC-type branched-subunit amino acid transport system ATPase component
MLEVEGVTVRYGEVVAVDGVSLSVEAGAIVGVIGPNGAGKTSLIDGLSGFAPLAGGSVTLGGIEITTAPPHGRAQLGLARTWQSGELYEDLTVEENLLAVADSPSLWSPLIDILRPSRKVAGWEEVNDLLARLGLVDLRDRIVSEVPHDIRKLVGIGRALATKPKVLLADEPAAGLTSEETGALGEQLRRVAAEGVAIVLIEHDMELVLSVCDEVLVVDFGRPIAYGTPGQIATDPKVIAAYIGEAAEELTVGEGPRL